MRQILKIGDNSDLIRIKNDYLKKQGEKSFKILVCSGAGCISSNCHAVKDALIECLEGHGLTEKVLVTETGCIGTCDLGPVMTVTVLDGWKDGKKADSDGIVPGKGVFYTLLTPQDIPAIVESHLIDGKIKIDKTYFDRNLDRNVPYIEDIDYFKNQTKIALDNCGSIDYGSMEEYIANDGYMAISKVLNDF